MVGCNSEVWRRVIGSNFVLVGQMHPDNDRIMLIFKKQNAAVSILNFFKVS